MSLYGKAYVAARNIIVVGASAGGVEALSNLSGSRDMLTESGATEPESKRPPRPQPRPTSAENGDVDYG